MKLSRIIPGVVLAFGLFALTACEDPAGPEQQPGDPGAAPPMQQQPPERDLGPERSPAPPQERQAPPERTAPPPQQDPDQGALLREQRDNLLG